MRATWLCLQEKPGSPCVCLNTRVWRNEGRGSKTGGETARKGWGEACRGIGPQSFSDLERSYDPLPLKGTNRTCLGPEEEQLSN